MHDYSHDAMHVGCGGGTGTYFEQFVGAGEPAVDADRTVEEPGADVVVRAHFDASLTSTVPSRLMPSSPVSLNLDSCAT